jgi:hypothetical protein
MAEKKDTKAHSALGCTAQSCRKDISRFNFCAEHFEHFKFGLIKKDGLPVSDYEKKLGHFQAYKKKLVAQKVA